LLTQQVHTLLPHVRGLRGNAPRRRGLSGMRMYSPIITGKGPETWQVRRWLPHLHHAGVQQVGAGKGVVLCRESSGIEEEAWIMKYVFTLFLVS